MAKAMMGALISDGGNGAFPADILCIGGVNVVVANPDLGGIQFNGYPKPTHEIVELPDRVYSSKKRGIFVVPMGQLVEIAPAKLAFGSGFNRRDPNGDEAGR